MKEIILVIVQKKERKTSRNYKEPKRKQKENKQFYTRFIVACPNRPELEINNCVKLKLVNISLSRILAFY